MEVIQYALVVGGSLVMLSALLYIGYRLISKWTHPCDCALCRTEKLLIRTGAWARGYREARRTAALENTQDESTMGVDWRTKQGAN